MTEHSPFQQILPETRRSPRSDPAAALAGRPLPPVGGDLAQSASAYEPSADLVEAVNVALATGQPLLVTGEPGTGKTQLAYFLREYFGLAEERLFRLDVRSTTTHEDLTYGFDAVAYLHAANDPARESEAITKGEFVTEGVLWRAYETGGPTIVLIDEIDKAPRDFPNDLLRVLDEHSFYCAERERTVRAGDGPPPLILVTSNNERRLPDAFLRRCAFHHIELSESLLGRAVKAHLSNPAFPDLGRGVADAAVKRFLELRDQRLNKPPSLGELIMWLAVLAAKSWDDAAELGRRPLGELPALNCLVKDQDDLKSLG